MSNKKEILTLITIFCLFFLLFQTVGCRKDYIPGTIQGENESESIQDENESEILLPEDCPQGTHYCPISKSCIPDSTIEQEQGLQSKLDCPYITLSWDKDEKAVSYEIIPFYDENKDEIEDGKCEEDISNTKERYFYYNLESIDCAAYYTGNIRFQIIPQYSDGLSIDSYNTEWIDVSLCKLESNMKSCSDDSIDLSIVPHNTCSVSKPYFCYDGNFIKDCSKCGCPAGEECKEGICIKESILEDNAFIIYSDDFFSISTWGGEIASKIFYNENPSKKYDFLYIISEDWAGGGAGFAQVSNNGTNNFLKYSAFSFDASFNYGADYPLKGVVVDRHGLKEMYDEKGYFVEDTTWYFNRIYFGTVIHELMHNWGVFLPLELKECGSKDYLGNYYNDGHWTGYIGSWISVEGDTKTKIKGDNGKYYFYYNCTSEPINHDFELYAMGLKSLNEVHDNIFIFNDTSFFNLINDIEPFSECDKITEIPKGYITDSYSIQDFIEVINGEYDVSLPSVETSQKNYNIAFILVKRSNSKINEDEINALNWMTTKSPLAWYKSTYKRSTINKIIPSDENEPKIIDARLSKEDNSITVQWKTNKPATSSVVYTNEKSGYVKVAPTFVYYPPVLSTNHKVIISSNEDSNLGYYGTEGYKIRIVSIDEDLNIAVKELG